MKFSTVASVATLFSGVIAAPHREAAVAKRTDLTALVATLKTEVKASVDEANKVANTVLQATATDLDLTANLTAGLVNLNSTIAAVDATLTALGLAALVPTVDQVGQDANGLVASAAVVANTIVAGLLNTTTAFTNGTGASANAAVDGIALAATDVATVLDQLETATGITTAMGQLSAAIGGTLANVTIAVKSGKVGASGSAVAGGKTVATASTADLGSDLQGLIATIAYVLYGIVGKL